jgi:hypothetical protein
MHPTPTLDAKECKCSFRIRTVGDGCSVCNPEYWKEMLEEQAQPPSPPVHGGVYE